MKINFEYHAYSFKSDLQRSSPDKQQGWNKTQGKYAKQRKRARSCVFPPILKPGYLNQSLRRQQET